MLYSSRERASVREAGEFRQWRAISRDFHDQPVFEKTMAIRHLLRVCSPEELGGRSRVLSASGSF
jgi:hypothetical protein